MQERLILGVIGLALVFGLAILICCLPFIIFWDWYSSKNDVDKQLRDNAQLILLKKGSLGS